MDGELNICGLLVDSPPIGVDFDDITRTDKTDKNIFIACELQYYCNDNVMIMISGGSRCTRSQVPFVKFIHIIRFNEYKNMKFDIKIVK